MLLAIVNRVQTRMNKPCHRISIVMTQRTSYAKRACNLITA